MGGSSIPSFSSVPPSSPSQPRIVPVEQSSFNEGGDLHPAMFLGQNRYRLLQKLERLNWYQGAYEARWLAQERSGEQVMLSEVMLPIQQVRERQLALPHMLRVANAASWHTHLPKLLQVFREQGHDFFVFQWFQAETMQDRVKRMGHPFPERDLVQFCLSILNDAIAPFALQNPPITHGLINPEHLFLTRETWFLSNCSLVLASQQSQNTATPNWTMQSPYLPPEVGTMQSTMDGRLDLYSVLAVVYFALTGTSPQDMTSGRIIPVRQKNPFVSDMLERILAKGLNPSPEQRYQSVSELQYDLQSLTTTPQTTAPPITSVTAQGNHRSPVTSLGPADPLSRNAQTTSEQPLSDTTSLSEKRAESFFDELDNLPMFVAGNDALGAFWWLLGILGIALLVTALR